MNIGSSKIFNKNINVDVFAGKEWTLSQWPNIETKAAAEIKLERSRWRREGVITTS